MEKGFQFRDVFNPTVVNNLAQAIFQSWPDFDVTGFATHINDRLESLSFGDRNALIRDTLKAYLPDHFPKAAQILIDSLGPELAECELTGYDGFIIMPQCDYVARSGLADFDISMQALFEMTKRFTAEGAIRAFIETYPDKTLQQLDQWAENENCHVRRLVSEGTRPRLPLAPRLTQFIHDPQPVLKLLDKLKADPVLLVRRSVANNLNDIAKDHPDLVVDTLEAWHKSKDKGTQWIISHASRTLVKQGHPGVLALLGYPPNPAIALKNLALNDSVVHLGQKLDFGFDVRSEADRAQNLMIDYVIHHVKANGRLTAKVFKLTQKKLKPGETLTLSKKHPFRPITTRTYYPGRHLLQIQINGKVWAETAFELSFRQTE